MGENDARDTTRRITDEEPRPIRELNSEIPEWLCHIIARLMSKQPDARFESAREVAELLEECLAHVQQPNIVTLPQRACPPTSPARKPQGRSPLFKLLLRAAFVFTLIFAGILIVLELNKGTLTIESNADNVPVRITRGDKVVEKLTITRAGASVRIAAGRYEIELLTETDGLVVRNGTFTLTRGKEHVARIEQVEASAAPSPSVRRAERGDTPLWNEFGVTPSPVAPLTAKGLEWIGLHLSPITRDRFRDKNVFAKYAGGLDVTFVRTHGPAEKAGIHEVDIVVGLHGRPTANLEDLDSAMQDAIEQIERKDTDALQFDVLRSGETVRVNVPFPLGELELPTPEPNSDSSRAAKQQPEGSAMTKGRRDFAAAQLRVDRARTPLELYRKVDSPDESERSAAKDRDTVPLDNPAARAYRDKLRERWKLLEEAYKVNEAGLDDVLTAAAQYYEAAATVAESAQERRNARQQQVDQLKQLVEVMKALFRNNQVGQADVLAAEAELLKAAAQLKRGRIKGDRARKVPGTVD